MVIPAQDRKHRINTANNLKKVNDTYIAGLSQTGFKEFYAVWYVNLLTDISKAIKRHGRGELYSVIRPGSWLVLAWCVVRTESVSRGHACFTLEYFALIYLHI